MLFTKQYHKGKTLVLNRKHFNYSNINYLIILLSKNNKYLLLCVQIVFDRSSERDGISRERSVEEEDILQIIIRSMFLSCGSPRTTKLWSSRLEYSIRFVICTCLIGFLFHIQNLPILVFSFQISTNLICKYPLNSSKCSFRITSKYRSRQSHILQVNAITEVE